MESEIGVGLASLRIAWNSRTRTVLEVDGRCLHRKRWRGLASASRFLLQPRPAFLECISVEGRAKEMGLTKGRLYKLEND